MSDSWLIFVPHDPECVPAPSAQSDAVDMLRTLFRAASDVSANVSDAIQFIDSGGNFGSVFCPRCGAIANGPAGWWNTAMSAAGDWQRGFVDLSVTTPCCATQTSLNDLDYSWPCGFARFTLSVMNPGQLDLGPEQFNALERMLGCRLRRVYRHT